VVGGLALWQVRLAQAALALSGIVGVYFLAQVLFTREACYGVAAINNPCESLTAGSFLRLIFVVGTMALLFAGAWGSARAQQTTPIADNRFTFLMSMIFCTVILVGVTLSALGGPGFYYLPATLVLVVATILGGVDLWQRERTQRAK
jgi:uncharacterized membrane protein